MTNLHWGLMIIIIFAVFYFGFFMACIFAMRRSKQPRMKRVYIAHPFQGNYSNYQKATKICRKVAENGYLPISPIHAFSFLNDLLLSERQMALKFCRELVLTCDELWLCGDWQNSEGCKMELQMALDHGIPITYYVERA